jgi:hypothetical protein
MASNSVTSPHGSLFGRTVVDVQWAIEVVVSSSYLRSSRLNATPLVHVTLTLDDGRALSYRLSQAELHQWRYTLARSIKDLEYLERKRRPAPTGKKATAAAAVAAQ